MIKQIQARIRRASLIAPSCNNQSVTSTLDCPAGGPNLGCDNALEFRVLKITDCTRRKDRAPADDLFVTVEMKHAWELPWNTTCQVWCPHYIHLINFAEISFGEFSLIKFRPNLFSFNPGLQPSSDCQGYTSHARNYDE
jgi:hypothetical protein